MANEQLAETLGKLFDEDAHFSGGATNNRTFTAQEREMFIQHVLAMFNSGTAGLDFTSSAFIKALLRAQRLYDSAQDQARALPGLIARELDLLKKLDKAP